jgi:hypothetical protein
MSCGDCGDKCTCPPAGAEALPTLVERLTPDKGRAFVARRVIEFLAGIAKTIGEDGERYPEGSPEREGAGFIVGASKELALQLGVRLAQLERPRILRPERSVKVVR